VPDVLVTGTDTGVGKTVIAAGVILALRARGVRGVGFKPCETGVGSAESADSTVLAEASGVDEPLARPLLRLAEPLAPAMAAQRARTALDPNALEERIRALRAAGYSVVVEGAGGLLVPLAWGYTALDLTVRLSLDTIVVARAGLGTLNHVALTIRALQSRDVRVRGVVLNARGEPPDLAEATNESALERLIPGIRVVTTPRLVDAAPIAAARQLAMLDALL
jgi:dethiobiotin synthetase